MSAGACRGSLGGGPGERTLPGGWLPSLLSLRQTALARLKQARGCSTGGSPIRRASPRVPENERTADCGRRFALDNPQRPAQGKAVWRPYARPSPLSHLRTDVCAAASRSRCRLRLTPDRRGRMWSGALARRTITYVWLRPATGRHYSPGSRLANDRPCLRQGSEEKSPGWAATRATLLRTGKQAPPGLPTLAACRPPHLNY